MQLDVLLVPLASKINHRMITPKKLIIYELSYIQEVLYKLLLNIFIDKKMFQVPR
jgi:hypothetical protein